MIKKIYNDKQNYNVVKAWPCEYCKCKFYDVRDSITHELYLCKKNPKFKYDSNKLDKSQN